MPTQQSEDTAKTLRSEIESLSDEHLTAFQAGAAATKSLVLSLALVHGRLNSEDVAACAHLDEIFQAEQWGEDRQALIRRRDVDAEIRSVGQYLQLLS
jgi:chaperone required for assembly of F1-ATPase